MRTSTGRSSTLRSFDLRRRPEFVGVTLDHQIGTRMRGRYSSTFQLRKAGSSQICSSPGKRFPRSL
jgi:hypothetical protein